MSDAGHKTGEGRLHRLQLSLWDDRPDRRRLMELMSLVENALTALAGDIGGHRLVSFRLARSLVMRYPIGVEHGDRKSGVAGKAVSDSVDLGGRRKSNKKKKI